MIIPRLSRYMSRLENIVTIYAIVGIGLAIVGILTLPLLSYDTDQIYPKDLHPESSLYPYERGGAPFQKAIVAAQYPENSPYLGYVTGYLTPLSSWMADTTRHLGTTIVSHPGGIIDEILYNTRGLDTVVETSILFVAFGIAAFLFRRGDHDD